MSFNPSQPRDENGRWTGVGSSSGRMDDFRSGGLNRLGSKMSQFQSARGMRNSTTGSGTASVRVNLAKTKSFGDTRHYREPLAARLFDANSADRKALEGPIGGTRGDKSYVPLSAGARQAKKASMAARNKALRALYDGS